MSSGLARLFGYERPTRSLAGDGFDDELIRNEYTSFESIRDLLGWDIVKNCGLTEQQLAYELAQIIKQRLVAVLMPEAALFEDHSKVKPLIRKHIESLDGGHDEDLVSALKFFANNFRNKAQKSRRKLSIEDVKLEFPSAFERINLAQGGRCKICGVPLLYGSNMELDHIIPWHLGDDPYDGSNWQFVCGDCNKGKSEWMHYTANLGRVASISTKAQTGLHLAVRYAAISRDRKCTTCSDASKKAELIAIRRRPTGCWVLDNLMTICKRCFSKES